MRCLLHEVRSSQHNLTFADVLTTEILELLVYLMPPLVEAGRGGVGECDSLRSVASRPACPARAANLGILDAL